MDQVEELNSLGRVWLRGLLAKADLVELAKLTDVGEKPGARLSLTKELSRLVGPKSHIGLAVQAFGVDANPVRLVAFNKSEAANWSVPWHQDRVIAVVRKADIDGYSNWVSKSGFWHCEAPPSLLSTMIFVRIHIDTSSEESGPLELALRSHQYGNVPANAARAIASSCEIESCQANPGDVLLVHALTLHRSGSAAIPTARRTLRVDYTQRKLLAPELQWAENLP